MAPVDLVEIPKDELKVLLVYPNLPLMLTPSIAIGLFTSLLRKQGYQLKLFETTHYESDEVSSAENRVEMLNVRPFNVEADLGVDRIGRNLYDDFRELAEDFKPDLMVFSVVEDAFLQAVELLRAVQDLSIPHIFGGVFPTNAPEVCMEFPEINFIGLGEGENTNIYAAEAVRCGKPLAGIPGTWHRNDDSSITKAPQGPLVNINDTRPDFSLFERERFHRPMGGRVFMAMPIETYRGCPYSCTYCNSPAQRAFAKDNDLGIFLRRKTMENLFEELEASVALYNPEFFYFVDDSFLARPKKEIFDFCDMYEHFKLPFWFNTRAENCTEEILARLKEVNCYRISFGLEAGNEEYRDKVLLRRVSNAKYLDHFKLIADSGIAFSLNIIIGMPGETRALVMDTVEMVRSIYGFDALTVSIFTPYHGTGLRDIAVKNNWLDPKTITKHTTSSSVLNMPEPYLSCEDIDGLAAVFPLYCYFPRSDWDAIRRAETADEEGLKIRTHFAEIYQREFLGETQGLSSAALVEGGTGCRINPKDSFRASPKRLAENEIAALTLN